jgi:glutathione S-transferase
MTYKLYYWPEIPGRGEFVRLALEEAGAAYDDIARSDADGEGVPAVMARLKDRHAQHLPFAPPILVDGELELAQTALILLHLGDKLGLAPSDVAGRYWTHQIQLTITDFVADIHNVHHPLGSQLYYEDQKPEALRAAEHFRAHRLPKFLGWFERILEANRSGPTHLVGDGLTYVDLSLFHIVEGLHYAFPKATAKALHKTPHVVALHAAVKKRPKIKAYLASKRRCAFNEMGIFRYYPELDG